MSIARVAAGIPTGGQFAPTAHAEDPVALPPQPGMPVRPAMRVPTDRETLDLIATGLAEVDEWDTEMLEWIAGAVSDTGRPHPGEQVLTEAETELIEDRGDNVQDAAADRYREMLAEQRAQAAARPVPVDPADTMAVVRAHQARAGEANRAVELASTKALAQMVQAEWPDAAYIGFDTSESNGSMTPTRLLDEDFNEVGGSEDLSASLQDVYGMTANLTDNGHWTGWREFAPEDELGFEPMLAVREVAHLDLDDFGAGAPTPPPAPGETLYTGADRKVTGRFGQASFTPRDGKPGTLILIDTAEGRADEPLVVMVNDQVIDVPTD